MFLVAFNLKLPFKSKTFHLGSPQRISDIHPAILLLEVDASPQSIATALWQTAV